MAPESDVRSRPNWPLERSADEPADLRPLEPGEFHELRVLGVAGSSPESMLGLQARLGGLDVERAASECGVEPKPGDISVWCPPHVEPELRAWSWGSLTSGRWYQAFYSVAASVARGLRLGAMAGS
jgi:hypothetical protein